MHFQNRGLEAFIHAKQLNAKKTISDFLESQNEKFCGIRKAEIFIQNNWNKFASFVDKGLKAGTLTGRDVRLNYGYEEQAKRNALIREEEKMLTNDEFELYLLLKKKAPITVFSKASSFFNKRGFNIPANNNEATARALKCQPKLKFILEHDLYNEFLESLNQ